VRQHGTAARLGVQGPVGYLRVCSLTKGGCVAWMLRLVKIGVEGEGACTDVMQVNRPDDLRGIADPGLTLGEAVAGACSTADRRRAGQGARRSAAGMPALYRACRVKDYRDTGTMRSRRCSAKSRCGFPAFAVPRVAGSRLASIGHRIAGRHRSWTGFRRISAP